MEKRASEDKVNLHSDTFKRCKKCGTVENEFYYDRQQPNLDTNYNNPITDQTNTNQLNMNWGMSNEMDMDIDLDPNPNPNPSPNPNPNMEYGYDWGMDLPDMFGIGIPGYMNMNNNVYMDLPDMYMDQMEMNQVEMHQMSMDQMELQQMSQQMSMNQMGMDNLHLGMDGRDDMNVQSPQQFDQMFQIIGQMLEEIINRENRIINLIEELIANQR